MTTYPKILIVPVYNEPVKVVTPKTVSEDGQKKTKKSVVVFADKRNELMYRKAKTLFIDCEF